MTDASITRRAFTLGAIAVAGSCALPRARAAVEATGKTVQFIVPFAPGTTPDVLSRLLGSALGRVDGNSYITDNRVGASGMIGLQAVSRAPADGRTLTVNTNTALTLPFFYKKVPFDVLTGFTPVAMLGITNFALCVNGTTGIKTLPDFLAAARRTPAKMTYATPGMGTLHHLCMELLMAKTGVKLEHVPYKGAANAISDLLGGHVDAMFLPMHVAVPQAANGKLAVLGSTRRQADKGQPQVRPLADIGVPGYEADSWYAVWAPPGLPAEQVTALNATLNRLISADPEVRQAFDKQGIVAQPMTPAQLQTLATAEHDKWREVIAAAGIQPE